MCPWQRSSKWQGVLRQENLGSGAKGTKARVGIGEANDGRQGLGADLKSTGHMKLQTTCNAATEIIQIMRILKSNVPSTSHLELLSRMYCGQAIDE